MILVIVNEASNVYIFYCFTQKYNFSECGWKLHIYVSKIMEYKGVFTFSEHKWHIYRTTPGRGWKLGNDFKWFDPALKRACDCLPILILRGYHDHLIWIMEAPTPRRWSLYLDEVLHLLLYLCKDNSIGMGRTGKRIPRVTSILVYVLLNVIILALVCQSWQCNLLFEWTSTDKRGHNIYVIMYLKEIKMMTKTFSIVSNVRAVFPKVD